MIIGTGTEWGHSFWQDVAFGCSTRAALKKMYDRDETSPPDDLRLEVGSIGHALIDYYLACPKTMRGFTLNQIDWSPWTPSELALQTAWRTFEGFRLNYEPENFGKIVGTEYPLPFPCKKPRCKKHVPDQAVELADGLGLPSFTTALDLVTHLRPYDCKRYDKLFDVRVEPGIWIHDWKFVANASHYTADHYYSALQPLLGMRAWDLCHPLDRGVKGWLYHLIEKLEGNKVEFKMLTIKIPQLRTRDLAKLELFSSMAMRNYHFDPEIMSQLGNLARCRDWGRPCQFQIDGLCPHC